MRLGIYILLVTLAAALSGCASDDALQQGPPPMQYSALEFHSSNQN